jgi:hypothetical protein
VINGWCDIPKSRIYGTYHIDKTFYPGPNADWQHKLFHFEIRENDEFIFYELLADGSYKRTVGVIAWYRKSSPFLFRVETEDGKLLDTPLVDSMPSLYRGCCRFYYVFESKYGNMFYRKTGS